MWLLFNSAISITNIVFYAVTGNYIANLIIGCIGLVASGYGARELLYKKSKIKPTFEGRKLNGKIVLDN